MPPLIAILLCLMVGICFIVWILLQSIKPIPKSQFRQQRFSRETEEYEPNPSSYPQKKSIRSSQDYRYLLTLLNGDESGAKRLINNIEDIYPERGTQWAIEKAINDILRDRR